MNEEHDINLPPDADDLSKHAPALFALKGTETGLVVPALYFEELSELVVSKTAIPEDGGLPVPENYFEESAEQIFVKALLPENDGLIVPEHYFEELSSVVEAKTKLSTFDFAQSDNRNAEEFTVPENYFDAFAENLESQIAVESALPKTEGEIPEGYFAQMQSELHAHIALDNLKQDEGFVVPEHYFEKAAEQIINKNAGVRLSGAEAHNDEVPAGYFDSLHDKVVARIENESRGEKGRVIVFSEWKKYATVTAVAASVALLIAFAWTFTGSNKNGEGSLLVASNRMNFVPESGVKQNQQTTIDSVPAVNAPVVDGIAAKTPKKTQGVKPNNTNEVIMSDADIIAQTDVMDESMVMEFVAENSTEESTDEVLDPAMMEYLLNDNSGFELFVPADKKN